MSAPLVLVITSAGLDALVDAQNGDTDAIKVAQVGITETEFVAAPTLVALPGEVTRIDAVAGQSVAENIIHMAAQDSSFATYDMRGLALYLEDGTLFASYSQATPLLRKVAPTVALIAFDIAFSADVGNAITFGDAVFLYPPATETVRGTARIATQARVDAAADGADDAETIVTPKTLRARLASFIAAVNEALAGFAARTITGTGLATGGGSLAENRQIDVAAATAADLLAGIDNTKALTPKTIGDLPSAAGAVSYDVLPGGGLLQRGQVRTTLNGQQVIHVTFPVAFADTNFDLQLTAVIGGAGDFDNYLQELAGTRTTTGVNVFVQDPSGGASGVLAGFNWRAEGRFA